MIYSSNGVGNLRRGSKIISRKENVGKADSGCLIAFQYWSPFEV